MSVAHEPIDMAEAYVHVAALPDTVLMDLERGPLTTDTECAICRICRKVDIHDEHNAWVLAFHGMDAMKCGVIYGMAKAIRQERWKAGIERLRREHPEAYASRPVPYPGGER